MANGVGKSSCQDKEEAARSTGLSRPGKDLSLREEKRNSRAKMLPWVLLLAPSLGTSGI